jgi:hypothetical protein
MKATALILLASLILSGCNAIKPIYYYGDYQKTVYRYFTADDIGIAEQIHVMHEVIEKAPEKGLLVAPGAHAHLGMLYFEAGDTVRGKLHFEQEKALFPESTAYINFLLKNLTGVAK